MDYRFLLLLLFGVVSLASASYFSSLLFSKGARSLGIKVFAPGRKNPISLWGGAAFMFFAAFLFLVFLGEPSSPLGHSISPVAVIFLGVIALIFFGMLDDVVSFGPLPQLISQILITSAIVFGAFAPSGVSLIYASPASFLASLNSLLSLPVEPFMFFGGGFFAILLIITFVNAANWLDGLDGLAASVAILALTGAGLFALFTGLVYPAVFLFLFASAIFGFFLLNFPLAKIYMGTSGSMGIGLVLGIMAFLYPQIFPVILGFFALPLGDAFVVIVRRLYAGASPLRGDRRHLHYLLFDAGLGTTRIVFLYGFLTILFGLGTIMASFLGQSLWGALASVVLAAVISTLGAAFLRKKEAKNNNILLAQNRSTLA